MSAPSQPTSVYINLLTQALADPADNVRTAAFVALEECASISPQNAKQVISTCVANVTAASARNANDTQTNKVGSMDEQAQAQAEKAMQADAARLRLCGSVCRATRKSMDRDTAVAAARTAMACLERFAGGNTLEIHDAAAAAVAAAARVDASTVSQLVLEYLAPGQATPPGAALALRELAASCEPWDFASLLRECMPRLCTGLGQVREDAPRALLSEVLSAFSVAADALEDAGKEATSPRADATAAIAASWHGGNAALVKEEVGGLFRSALELLFSTWLPQARQPELRASVAEACGALCLSLSTGDLAIFAPKLLPALLELHKREAAGNAPIAALGVARGFSRVLAAAAATPTSGALDRTAALSALAHMTTRLARAATESGEDVDAESIRARAREQQELLRSAEACVRLHVVDTTGWLVACLSGSEGAAASASNGNSATANGGVNNVSPALLRLGSLIVLRHCVVSLASVLGGQRGVLVGGIATALGGFVGSSVTNRRALIGLVASMAPIGYLAESGGDKLFAAIPETLAEMAGVVATNSGQIGRDARLLRDACDQAMQLVANDTGADSALWPLILDLLVRPNLLTAAPALCRAAISIARRRAEAATDASAASWNDAERRRRALTAGKLIALMGCGDNTISALSAELLVASKDYLHPHIGAAWQAKTPQELCAKLPDEATEDGVSSVNSQGSAHLAVARMACESLAHSGSRDFLYECARGTLADVQGCDTLACAHLAWFPEYRLASLRWLGKVLAALPEDGNRLGATAGASGGGISASAFATECLSEALASMNLSTSDARESAARLFGDAAAIHLDASLTVLRSALDAADAADAAAAAAAAANNQASPFAAIASFFGTPQGAQGNGSPPANAGKTSKDDGPLKATTSLVAARAGLAFALGLCAFAAPVDLQRARCETHVLPMLLEKCNPIGALRAGLEEHSGSASERRAHFCAGVACTVRAASSGGFVLRRRDELLEAALVCAEAEAQGLGISKTSPEAEGKGNDSPDKTSSARSGSLNSQTSTFFGSLTPSQRTRSTSGVVPAPMADSEPPCTPSAVISAKHAADALCALMQGEVDGAAVSRTRAVLISLVTRPDVLDAPSSSVSLYLLAADTIDATAQAEARVIVPTDTENMVAEAQRQLDLALGALACALLNRTARSASGAVTTESRLSALGDMLSELDVLLLRNSLTITQRRRLASLALSLVASCTTAEGAATGQAGTLRLGSRLVAPLALACDADAATRGVAAALASALCACAGVGVPAEAAAMVGAARDMLLASAGTSGDVASGSSLARRLDSARGAARPATAALDATELAGLIESCCACCARAQDNLDAPMGSALVVADALAARGAELAANTTILQGVCASILIALDTTSPPSKEVANALLNGLRSLARACQDVDTSTTSSGGEKSLPALFRALLHGQAFRTKRRRPAATIASDDALFAPSQRAAQVICQDSKVCEQVVAFLCGILWDAPLTVGSTESEADKRNERLLLLLDAEEEGESSSDGASTPGNAIGSAQASYLPCAATDLLIASIGAQGLGGLPSLAAALNYDSDGASATSEDLYGKMLGALVIRAGRLAGEEQPPPPAGDDRFIDRSRASAVGAVSALFVAADASGRKGASLGTAFLQQRRDKALSSSAAVGASALGEASASSVVTERQRARLAAAILPGIQRYDAGVRTFAGAALGALCSSVHDFDDTQAEADGAWASTVAEQLVELIASDRASNVRRVGARSIGNLRDSELAPRGQRVLRALADGAADGDLSVASDSLSALPSALSRVEPGCALGAAAELQRNLLGALDKSNAELRAAALRAYEALTRAVANAENSVLTNGFRTRLRGNLARLFVHCMDVGPTAAAARGALKAAGLFESESTMLREALTGVAASTAGGGAGFAQAARKFAAALSETDASACCDVCARDALAQTIRGVNGNCRAGACTLLGAILCALDGEEIRSRAGIEEAVRVLAERSSPETETESIVRTAAVGALSRLLLAL